MAITTLTKENYVEEVVNSGKPVLIDFWATWCGPCKMMSPIVDEIAEELGDAVSVCKVNVDEQPELAGEYNIMSIPTLVVIRDGKIAATSVGVKSKQAVIDMING